MNPPDARDALAIWSDRLEALAGRLESNPERCDPSAVSWMRSEFKDGERWCSAVGEPIWASAFGRMEDLLELSECLRDEDSSRADRLLDFLSQAACLLADSMRGDSPDQTTDAAEAILEQSARDFGDFLDALDAIDVDASSFPAIPSVDPPTPADSDSVAFGAEKLRQLFGIGLDERPAAPPSSAPRSEPAPSSRPAPASRTGSGSEETQTRLADQLLAAAARLDADPLGMSDWGRALLKDAETQAALLGQPALAAALGKFAVLTEVWECLRLEAENSARDCLDFLIGGLGVFAEESRSGSSCERSARMATDEALERWGNYFSLLEDLSPPFDEPLVSPVGPQFDDDRIPQDSVAWLQSLCLSSAPPSTAGPAVTLPSHPQPSSEPPQWDDELREAFAADVEEQHERISDVILALKPGQDAESQLIELRRSLHTLKGASGMVGLSGLAAFIHHLEDRVESENGPVTPQLADALTDSLEYFENAFSSIRRNELPAPPDDRLWNTVGERPSEIAPPPPLATTALTPALAAPRPWELDEDLKQAFAADVEEQHERISDVILALKPGQDAESQLIELRRSLHTLKGASGMVGLSGLAAFIHHLEDRVESENGPVTPQLADALADSLEYFENAFSSIRRNELPEAPSPALREKIGHFASGWPTDDEAAPPVPNPISSAPGPAAPIPAMAQTSAAAPAQSQSSLAASPESVPQKASAQGDGLIRVPSERIDELMDIAAELITRRGRWSVQAEKIGQFGAGARICRNRLIKDVDQLRDLHGAARKEELTEVLPELLRRLAEEAEDLGVLAGNARSAAIPMADDGDSLSKLTLQLWDSLESIRLVPIKSHFQRLVRAIREAAKEPGDEREVIVELIGEETAVDRTIVEKAFEPLMHVVRNAVGHGIEPPRERVKVGKPPAGKIMLSASTEGGHLIIRVSDDGKGLDYPKIEARARERGYLKPNEAPTRERLNKIIFTAGFSTKDVANRREGKGVGMDVVATKVGELRGQVELTSQPGQGTIMTLRLPTRFALEKGVVVWIDGQLFALPVDCIETTVLFDPGDQTADGSLPALQVKGRRAPMVFARQALGLAGTPVPHNPKVLVVQTECGWIALMVDAIQGPRDLVIKPLPPLLSGHPLVSGMGFSTSGEVIFVLDPSGLARCRLTANSWQTAMAQSAFTVGRSKAVLVVDDSISVRRVAARRLRAQGYEVDEVSDGMEALQRLRLRTYRLVVSDLEMPRMDGFELLAELGRIGALETTPVVVASTKSDPETRRRVLQLGARAFLAKPIGPEEWSRAIDSILERSPNSSVIANAHVNSDANSVSHVRRASAVN